MWQPVITNLAELLKALTELVVAAKKDLEKN
jgi:hypothetical protein